ncbi:hypothetical protein SAMN04515620_11973 [Collimonas sp. OK607]|uniref:hypothetical protein n=1 Tax=Collimonas sp. OK607 TaxID=1798194 RepID=UPI0008E804C4|nr:hypothetical protein [Collimonas sp. OK607]SFB12586.1 hypothetical protein SAMN04515620_11973 [Collimonas sp. OK607]
MNKVDQPLSVKVRDRVTFDTDEGIQAGYVNDLRRDLGNGELHAWIEVEHQLPGCFRAVPLSDILTSDEVEPPLAVYFGLDPRKGVREFECLYSCNFETLANCTGEGAQ